MSLIVQEAHQGNLTASGSPATLQISLSGVAAGHALLLRSLLHATAGAPTVTKVTDSLGGTWKSYVVDATGFYSTQDQELWLEQVIPGVAGTLANVTVTVQLSGASDAGDNALDLYELLPVESVVAFGGQHGDSQVTNSPHLSPTAAGQFVIFFAGLQHTGATQPGIGAEWTQETGAQTFASNINPIAYKTSADASASYTNWTQPAGLTGYSWQIAGIVLAQGSGGSSSTGAGAPSVVEQAPTLLTSSGVQLNGTVNPNGVDTTYEFEWGLDTNYGNVYPAIAPPPPPPPPPPSNPVPTGISGSWALAFDEEFGQSALNLSTWAYGWPETSQTGAIPPQQLGFGFQAYYDSDMVTVGNGLCTLTVIANAATVGGVSYPYEAAMISSRAKVITPGSAIEWRVRFSGSGTNVVPNWFALWSASGDGVNELDMLEGWGAASAHFHSSTKGIADLWNLPAKSGSFHTIGAVYGSLSCPIYYDGTNVGTLGIGGSTAMYAFATIDIAPSKNSSAPTVVPATYDIDYLRVWNPA